MPDLDKDSFNKRLKRLYTHWQVGSCDRFQFNN